MCHKTADMKFKNSNIPRRGQVIFYIKYKKFWEHRIQEKGSQKLIIPSHRMIHFRIPNENVPWQFSRAVKQIWKQQFPSA